MSRPLPNLGLARPTHERAAERAAQSSVATRMVAGDPVQVKFDAPPEVYTALKVRCAERRITLRAYLLELLAKDGIE